MDETSLILAQAIVAQAVTDYLFLCQKQANKASVYGKETISKAELKEFFSGKWFGVLTLGEIDGSRLADLIEGGKVHPKKPGYLR